MTVLPTDVRSLAALFYEPAEQIGEFAPIPAGDMPKDYRSLLAHENHMTVTVEAFHDSLVNVEVLAEREQGHWYCRKIVLRRRDTGDVVLFGIVRLDLSAIPPEVSKEIRARETPLGRVLIRRNVLREVELRELFEIRSGNDLASHLGIRSQEKCYGRTAVLHVNGQPAIELLEIVTV